MREPAGMRGGGVEGKCKGMVGIGGEEGPRDDPLIA